MSFIPTPHTGDLTLGWREVCSFRTVTRFRGPGTGITRVVFRLARRKWVEDGDTNQAQQAELAAVREPATGLPTQTVVVCRVLPYEEKIQGVLCVPGIVSAGIR